MNTTIVIALCSFAFFYIPCLAFFIFNFMNMHVSFDDLYWDYVLNC